MKEEWDRWLKGLQNVTDEDMCAALVDTDLKIDSDKFNFAFSGITVPEFFSNLPDEVIRNNAGFSSHCDVSTLESFSTIKSFSIFIIKGYIAFLYMRSDTLEKGLERLPEKSALSPYRNFFSKSNPKTPAQHIRNALAHGHISINRDKKKLEFIDGDWSALIGFETFDNFCNEIKRFYIQAYKSKKNA